MATGRTLGRYGRLYLNTLDMGSYTTSIGPFTHEFEVIPFETPMVDEVRGYMLGRAITISPGKVNGVLHARSGDVPMVAQYPASTNSILTYAVGIRAAPAAGDPVFCTAAPMLNYLATESGGAVTFTADFADTWRQTYVGKYGTPWGALVHAYAARTAANSSAGFDDPLASGATTNFGGYMTYHTFTGDGTATITVQHSTTTNENASFGDLGGCTTGELDFSTNRTGIVETTTATTAVGRYLRWQIALNSANTVTFVLSFVRGLRAY